MALEENGYAFSRDEAGTTVTADRVRRIRIHAQSLHHPAPARDLVKVVRSLGGINAQFGPAMALSLRARIKGLTQGDIADAIGRRHLVRTWAMRGTLHLVDRDDIGWMVSLLGPGQIKKGAGRRLELGLDEEKVERALEAIKEILRDGGPMARSELTDRLICRGLDIDPKSQAPYHLFSRAALEGLIYVGTDGTDGEQTYYLNDEKAKGKPLSRDETLAALTIRYLDGYGPAGPKDFAAWSGLPAADAKRGWDLLQGTGVLRAVEAEGRTLWSTEAQFKSPEKPAETGTVVNLLPAFDTFVLGYADRGLLVPEKYQREVYHGGQTVPVVLVDGVAAGVWRYERKGKKLLVKVSPFEPFTGATRELIDKEAEDIGRFFGLRISLAHRA